MPSPSRFIHLLPEAFRNPRLVGMGLTIGFGWGGRVVAAVAQLLAVRILTGLLGVEGFGAYAVITGLLAWFMLADLGFGSSLQNHLSRTRVAGGDAAGAVQSTLSLLALSTLAVIALVLAISPLVGPFLLSEFPDVSGTQAMIGFAVFGVLASATGAASIAGKICFSEHRGYLAHAMTAGGAVGGLTGLLIVGHLRPPNLFGWVLFAYYTPFLVIQVAFLLWRYGPGALRPRWSGDRLGALWREARSFLTFGATASLVLNLDFVILAKTVSPTQVATYAVLAKIYALGFFVYYSVLQAYWPVSTEAMSQGDVDSVRRALRKCLLSGVLIVLSMSALLALALPQVESLLAPQGELAIPASLIPLFAGYWLIRVWCDSFGTLIMSAGKTTFLSWIVPVQAIFSLGLGYWGAVSYGVPGFVVGLSLSFVLTVAWALPLFLRRHLTTLAGRQIDVRSS